MDRTNGKKSATFLGGEKYRFEVFLVKSQRTGIILPVNQDFQITCSIIMEKAISGTVIYFLLNGNSTQEKNST